MKIINKNKLINKKPLNAIINSLVKLSKPSTGMEFIEIAKIESNLKSLRKFM